MKPDGVILSAETARAHAQTGALLGPTEFAAILQIKKSRFHVLAKAGAFDQFKVRPALGPKCYSGVLITRWLQGETVAPTFGRSRHHA